MPEIFKEQLFMPTFKKTLSWRRLETIKEYLSHIFKDEYILATPRHEKLLNNRIKLHECKIKFNILMNELTLTLNQNIINGIKYIYQIKKYYQNGFITLPQAYEYGFKWYRYYHEKIKFKSKHDDFEKYQHQHKRRRKN